MDFDSDEAPKPSKARRMPAPWAVQEIPGGFVVVDAAGRRLAYIYTGMLHAMRTGEQRLFSAEHVERLVQIVTALELGTLKSPTQERAEIVERFMELTRDKTLNQRAALSGASFQTVFRWKHGRVGDIRQQTADRLKTVIATIELENQSLSRFARFS